MSVAITKLPVRGGTMLRLEGVLDESLEPEAISGLGGGVLVFDLEGVHRVTSFGVRQWITGLRQLSAEYYCFINCHPSIVAQLNTVTGFAVNGEVVSLYAPFICNDCDNSMEVLIDLRQNDERLETLVVPDIECSKCGGDASFDDMPNVYFHCAISRRKPAPPPAANAIIDGRATGAPRELRVRKEIEDTVTAVWLTGFADKSGYFRRLGEGVEGQVVVVMSDADGFSPDGLKGFQRLVASLNETVYLARVPVPLLPSLSPLFEDKKCKARIASIRVDFPCTGCDKTTPIDLTASWLASRVSEHGNLPCPHCATPISLDVPAPLRAIIDKLPTARAPESVEAYLRHHSRDVSGSHPGAVTTSSGTLALHGELVVGKYRLVRQLGSGGMGDVYLARAVGPANFEKLVVLKRVRRGQMHDDRHIEMFMREARIAARLSHPNIVQIFDFGRSNEGYFIVMEYVNGIDLSEALRLSLQAGHLWPISLWGRVVSEVCNALHAAHTNVDENGLPSPIVHRDVSPANVLLAHNGSIKLTDFGIAKSVGDLTHTEAGAFKGKLAYAAPEQMRPGGVNIDARVDVYGAGVMAYECLTLRRYGQEDVAGRAPTLASMRSDIPPGLQHVLEKAVALDRDQRYPTARAFQEAIEATTRGSQYVSMADIAMWVQGMMTMRAALDAV